MSPNQRHATHIKSGHAHHSTATTQRSAMMKHHDAAGPDTKTTLSVNQLIFAEKGSDEDWATIGEGSPPIGAVGYVTFDRGPLFNLFVVVGRDEAARTVDAVFPRLRLSKDGEIELGADKTTEDPTLYARRSVKAARLSAAAVLPTSSTNATPSTSKASRSTMRHPQVWIRLALLLRPHAQEQALVALSTETMVVGARWLMGCPSWVPGAEIARATASRVCWTRRACLRPAK